MAIMRVFRKGFSIASRMKKRNLVWMVILIVIFGATIMFTGSLAKYETDQLVELRGIVVSPSSKIFPTARELWDNMSALYSKIRDDIRGFYVIYGVHLNGVSIVTVWPFEGKGVKDEEPWVLDAFKKSAVIAGKYISGKYEALSHTGFQIKRLGPYVNMTEELYLGSEITFSMIRDSTVHKITFRIVGLVNGSSPAFRSFAISGEESILFVSADAFEDLVRDVLDQESVEKSDIVFIRRIIITVSGSPLGDMFERRDKVYAEISDFLKKRGMDDEFSVSSSGIEEQNYKRDFLIFLVVVLAFMVVTALLGILIVRSAHHDIATLRAIGWGNGDVLAFMLGQIVFLVIFSWLIALFLSLTYYAVQAIPIISALPFLASVGMIILAVIISYLTVRSWVLKIPPMEAFRRG